MHRLKVLARLNGLLELHLHPGIWHIQVYVGTAGLLRKGTRMPVRPRWRVVDGGRIHKAGDPNCRSCSDGGGQRPVLHKNSGGNCPGLVHFEAFAPDDRSWIVKSKCDVCGGDIHG